MHKIFLVRFAKVLIDVSQFPITVIIRDFYISSLKKEKEKALQGINEISEKTIFLPVFLVALQSIT